MTSSLVSKMREGFEKVAGRAIQIRGAKKFGDALQNIDFGRADRGRYSRHHDGCDERAGGDLTLTTSACFSTSNHVAAHLIVRASPRDQHMSWPEAILLEPTASGER